jgi:16S rRNA (cytidine1402-2'-O)-methyltransferase
MKLNIVATPIGNLDDMSPRGVQALRDADVIACEDTRRTRALLSHFNVPRPESFVSYRQGNEARAGQRLIDMLESGKHVALCSDSGFPGISDPGYRLIRLAIERGIDIQVIPGASSVTTALLASGLSTSSFTFKGYPPRKPGALKRFFEDEKDHPHTLIVFESPVRVYKTLQAALAALGDREAAVCFELTKKFERVTRGHLKDLCITGSQEPSKGEVTIVIAGNNPKYLRNTPSAS